MMCQQCNERAATLHFTKIVNGEKTEFHICENCAKEKGDHISGFSNGFSIHGLLSGLMDFESGKYKTAGAPSPETLRCEQCGMTFSQFSKLNRFGCSSCYNHFSSRLDPLLKRVHGNTTHIGKVPVRAGEKIHLKRRVDEFKREMQEKINLQEFEEAAKLRDQIRELEKEIAQE